MSTEKTKSRSHILQTVILAAALVVIILSVFQVYSHTTATIVDYNVDTMTELALHDTHSVTNSLNLRFNAMSSVAAGIRNRKPESIYAMVSQLAENISAVLDVKTLEFLGDDGFVYSNANLIARDDTVTDLCKECTAPMAVRFNSGNANITRRQELLMLAVPVNFTVDDLRLTHLVAFMDLSSLRNELEIESYGGEGSSCIIDREGNYVLNMAQSHSFLTFDSFFQDLEGARFAELSGADALRNTLEGLTESVVFSYTKNDIDHILVLTPLENSQWVFVNDVPASVFRKQSNAVMSAFYMMLTIVIAVSAAAVFLLARQRSQQQKLAHAEERASDLETIEQQNRELAQQQEALEQALNMANSANRAKTTFLNNMSHDIRTPMNAIIGYTGMAASHLDNKELLQSYLSKISQSSDHLLSLINDVLDMSRIESGKMTLSEKPESLSEILHTLRDIIQSNVSAKELDFFMDTNEVTHEHVVCDKLRLNQILLNILSNAIKYTQPGGTVAMRLRQCGVSESGYGHYEFRVKDNGMGMSQEFLKTIFDPFTRASSSTVSGIQGTGLGMAITKNIVDMMGGTIRIESEEGKGTEVIMNFDFLVEESAQESGRIAELEGMRGLVVDDDPNTSVSVSRMLRDIGMRSDWCLTGKEAVFRTETALQDGDLYKVYIIDWLMPDMNGIETTRRIRKIVGENVPVIVLTAYDWSDIEEEAREAGVTGFVSKPLFPSDLNAVLRRCCMQAEEDVPEEKTYNFEGRKILLVEDNEMNREIALDILEEDGFIVDTAEDGTLAVEKMTHAKPGQYDLILMDVQMPLMDGYEATKRIRALPDPDVANITIIAMTANAFEEDRQEALKAGMNDHLTKPVDVTKLKKVLAKYLDA